MGHLGSPILTSGVAERASPQLDDRDSRSLMTRTREDRGKHSFGEVSAIAAESTTAGRARDDGGKPCSICAAVAATYDPETPEGKRQDAFCTATWYGLGGATPEQRAERERHQLEHAPVWSAFRDVLRHRRGRPPRRFARQAVALARALSA
jgi:hypothetical protein